MLSQIFSHPQAIASSSTQFIFPENTRTAERDDSDIGIFEKRRRVEVKQRDPQLCMMCGHIRKQGEYAKYHLTRAGCQTPAEYRREKCDCEEIVKGRKLNLQHYHRCNCQYCIKIYDGL